MEANNSKEKIKRMKGNNVDFDDILPYAGEFGLYQIFLVISTMPFYFFGIFVYFGQLFMTETPDHWCWIPELQNLTTEERKSLAIPHHVNGFAKCKSYVANWSEVLGNGVVPNSNWKTQTCTNGWEYNLTEIPYPTISTELNWVCDQETNQALAQTIFFAGTIFGCVIFGVVADKFGRLPAIVGSCLMGCVGGVASMFARNFAQFAVCRFITGMAYDSCQLIVYLLILEFISTKYKTMAANLSFALFFTSATISLPWLALACGHWKTFTLVTSVPLASAIFVPLFLPESPRWLLSKGRVEDTEQKLLKISRINKTVIPVDVLTQFRLSYAKKNTEEKSKDIMIELLNRRILRKMIILISLQYFYCNFIFDLIMRSLVVLDFNFFVSFSIVSTTDLPALITLSFAMDRIGRRWLTSLSLLFCSIFSIVTCFVTKRTSIVFIFFARLCIGMALSASYQWAAEMLPTPVRGTYISVIHTIGYLATLLSPYVAYLDAYFSGAPFIAIFVVASIGGISALFLPETTNRDFPDTVNDAELLVSNQKFWNIPCTRTSIRMT